MKLLMLKGLPGSGKSTWAKQFVAQNPGWVRINKDSLREMMSSYRPGKDEELVLQWRNSLIWNALTSNKSIVVDDTNFHPKHEKAMREIIEAAYGMAIEFETKLFDTPLAECIKNDLKRHGSVGEKVIKKMWREYLAPKYEAPEVNLTLPTAIICDLDGTLCLHNGRSPYDTAKCGSDQINDTVYGLLLENMVRGVQIIFVSGRDDKFTPETTDWIERNTVIAAARLYMRTTGDRRPDDVVKQGIYDQRIKGKYNVKFVLDDRNRVVDMWRRNGLTCLQVADGDF